MEIILLLSTKKYYISKLLGKVSLANSKSKTYSKTAHSNEEIIQTNINYCKNFDLNIIEFDKSLPIMYWLPKRHKTRIGTRFIVASNSCSTEPQPDITSKIFMMTFNTVEGFHNESFFYSVCKKSWVVQNSFLIVTKPNKSMSRKKLNLFQLLTYVHYV